MRSKLILLVLAGTAALIGAAQAQVYVDGYTRQDGTYVAPHYRSAPDGNPFNNYSTQGNINPYTGQMGTVNPYTYQNRLAPPPAPPMGSSYNQNPYNGSSYGH